MSVVFFAAGCAGADSEEDPSPVAPPPAHALGDPNGTSGANGLLPEIYQANATTIEAILRAPLATSNTHEVVGSTVTTLLESADGRKLFSYAVGCALATHDYVTYTAPGATPTTFYGGGMLTTASAWRSQALGTQARLDVHTCIVARLNPTGTTVQIWLGGADVSGGVDATNAFPYFEALWAAPDPFTEQPVKVWPDQTWATACANEGYSLEEAAKTRVCGTNPGVCAIALGNKDTECTRDASGNWTCGGQIAIQTRLRGWDWNTSRYHCHVP